MERQRTLWLAGLCSEIWIGATVTIPAAKSLVDPPAREIVGHWDSVNWGFRADNAAVRPDGKVLLWKWPGWIDTGVPFCSKADPVDERLWDPFEEQFQLVPSEEGMNNECVGFTHLADGRLLIVGGHPCVGMNHATILGPNDSWTEAKAMHKDRWYPSAIRLGDGRVLVLLGNVGNLNSDHREPFPEVYDPETDLWQVLWNAPFPGCPCSIDPLTGEWVCDDCEQSTNSPTYPPIFLLTDGRVFFAHHQPDAYPQVLDLNADPPAWEPEQYDNLPTVQLTNARYAMYRPGRVVRVGGPSGRTHTIDFTDGNPMGWVGDTQWSLNTPRGLFALVLLPDGRLMASGGKAPPDSTGVAWDVPEWVDPNVLGTVPDGKWQNLATMNYPSTNVHRLAVLLPDARVLSASGDGQNNAEVFSPPYLWVENAEAERPIIKQAPGQVTYDTEFRISIDTSIGISVDDLDLQGTVAVLMGLPAMTHGFDQNQRYVPLDIVSFSVEDSWISVKSPPNGNYAPPGYYMLFILTKTGVVNQWRVPSIAKFIRLVIDCPDCPDLTGDDHVGVADLLELLSCWGPVASGCEDADLNGDGDVGVADLLMLLAAWGPCATCGGESAPDEIDDCWDLYEPGTPEFEECIGLLEEDDDPPVEPD